MRVLVDCNHPAHVHLMRPAIAAWTARGDEVRVTARNKDVAVRLLTGYGIPHTVVGREYPGVLGRGREMLEREWVILRLARRFRPHLITGTTAHAGRVGLLVGAQSAVLNEDDARANPLFRWVCYPLAKAIVTPACLAYEDWGARHWTYRSYQEMFYLHPNRFTPDEAVAAGLRRDGKPYAIVRLSALQAYHDVGVRGISEQLLRALLQRAGGIRVYLSSEKPLSAELEPLRVAIPPEQMHDALAGAEFVVGDSQTMTAEAAVLGVPAFRINDFVGRLAYLEELQGYELAFGFKPGREQDLLDRLEAVLALPDRKAVFAARRARLLAETIDPLPWFLERVDRLVGAGT